MTLESELNRENLAHITPVITLQHALANAERGDPRDENASREALLNALHLDGDERDGLVLYERLTFDADGKPNIKKSNVTAIELVFNQLDDLFYSVKDGSANQEQLSLAKDLITVASTQLEREKSICPYAAVLMATAPRELVPIKQKAKIIYSASKTELQHLCGDIN